LYHVLVDGVAALNLTSLAALKKLQILMSKLILSCSFSRLGLGSFMPRGSISLLVTSGTPENYRTESILFDVAEVNPHFNAILGRSALYLLMAVAHYGYLILKMSSPNNVIKIHRDCSSGIFHTGEASGPGNCP
jgi:hypothetical protein